MMNKPLRGEDSCRTINKSRKRRRKRNKEQTNEDGEDDRDEAAGQCSYEYKSLRDAT